MFFCLYELEAVKRRPPRETKHKIYLVTDGWERFLVALLFFFLPKRLNMNFFFLIADIFGVRILEPKWCKEHILLGVGEMSPL